jgi:filamentous hemagglutinin
MDTNDALALFDLATGTNLNDKKKKVVSKTDKVTSKTKDKNGKLIKNTKVDIKSSNIVNKQYKKGTKPPYKSNTKVEEFVSSGKDEYVRVFNKDKTRPEGDWMMKEKDIKGLTPKQIKDKYALPEEPTHIIKVKPPKGTKMRTGEANKNFDGKGGGQQFETLEKVREGWGDVKKITK